MDPAQQLTLYHFPHSLCSQKVRLALAEKGVRYATRVVNIGPAHENYEPWYMRLNPRGVVPTLVHDGEPIVDSARIVRYIDEHLPGPPLQPEDPDAHAEMEDWIQRQDRFPMRELSYSSGSSFVLPLARGTILRRARVLEAHRRRNPALDAAYRARIADVQQWRRTVSSPEAIAELRAQLTDLLEALELQLADGRSFIAGERYSLADVVWTVFLARVRFLRGDGAFTSTMPRVRAYWERVRARPSFARADIRERVKPTELLPIVLPFLLPRVGAALLVLGLLGYSVWALVS
ncbi:MAG: glutathione S-transferase family protein [Myxococcales bacterium]|nr:glutathione S-transferase family protein [Myxococcales bacterium]MCB9750649.1 glutathione S-transferase family protein [Myxococcales bacterium]